MERGISDSVVNDLKARGHEIKIVKDVTGFGRGQIILRRGDEYVAASDNRADGFAIGY